MSSKAAQPQIAPAVDLLSLLSLEGVLVVVPWAVLLGRAAGAPADGFRIGLLGVGVWLGYSADRWLDGRRLGPRAATPRHRFAVRHARGLLLGWGLVGAGAALVALDRLPRELWLRGTALAALVGAWTVATHLHPRRVRRLIPREVAVGVLLAAAVGLFAWQGEGWSPSRVAALAAFAVLCSLNTVAVAFVEREGDACLGEPSIAGDLPQLERLLDPLCGVLGLVSIVISIALAGSPQALVWLALALASFALAAARRTAGRSTVPIDLACAAPAGLLACFA